MSGRVQQPPKSGSESPGKHTSETPKVKPIKLLIVVGTICPQSACPVLIHGEAKAFIN